MDITLALPQLVFGAGCLSRLDEGLRVLGVQRPLLLSDAGVASAGIVRLVRAAAPAVRAEFLDIPANPDVAAVDRAARLLRAKGCDAVIALGGGSVLDAGKIVAAVAATPLDAADLIGRPERLSRVLPMVAIPTTAGTGSEASPVAAVHRDRAAPAIGTRSLALVPRLAVCDPDLLRALPRALMAATAIDALSHCIEGYLAPPSHPVIDALALDGVTRVFADVHAALDGSDGARASLMAAAFAGGVAIHKGLGPAHAIALECGTAGHLHHGTLIAVALPAALRLVSAHAGERSRALARAAAPGQTAEIADLVAQLIASIGLPTTLAQAGMAVDGAEGLAQAMARSHFNRTSPAAPSADDYLRVIEAIAG